MNPHDPRHYAKHTGPILDLTYTLWQRVFGDITALGTWTLHDDRPCIVLVPTFARPDHARITPYVVPLEKAFQWDEATGEPEYTVRECVRAADGLGFSRADPGLLVRIHSIINDCLGDLLRMPPFPRHTEGEIAADVVARDPETGRIIHEGTVTDV